MNNNYEKIKAACQKVNPRLLDLSFGCYVIYKPIYSDSKKKAIINKIYSRSTRYITGTEFVGECILEDDDSTTAFRKENIVEILGHEPSFADILLVIGKYWGQDFNVGVNENKLNMAFIDVHQVTIISWDLTKPLKDQSEEVISFIAQLL